MEQLRQQIEAVTRGLEDRAQKDHDLLIRLDTTSQLIVTQLKEIDTHVTKQVADVQLRVAADIAQHKVISTAEITAIRVELGSCRAEVSKLKEGKMWALGFAAACGVIGSFLVKFLFK